MPAQPAAPPTNEPAFKVVVDRNQRLVRLTLVGVWTTQDADRLLAESFAFASSLGPEPAWRLLVDATRWAPQSDAVQERIVRTMQQNRRLGMSRAARVLSTPVMKLQLGRLAMQATHERRDFADEAEALAWLLS
jgi:hypothetical protein